MSGGRPGEGVTVWRVPLNVVLDPTALPRPERDQARALRLAAERRRYVAARLALRRLLGEALDCAPAAVRLDVGTRGKPYVAGGPEFSLSHAGDLALIALRWGAPVGVDLEALDVRLDAAAVAGLALSAGERAQLPLPAQARGRALLQIWCAKEAWLKLRGEGLVDALPRIEVAVAQRGAWVEDRRAEPISRQWVHWLFPAAGHVGALAGVEPHEPWSLLDYAYEGGLD